MSSMSKLSPNKSNNHDGPEDQCNSTLDINQDMENPYEQKRHLTSGLSHQITRSSQI